MCEQPEVVHSYSQQFTMNSQVILRSCFMSGIGLHPIPEVVHSIKKKKKNSPFNYQSSEV